MATSTFTTQSVFADARGARWRWVIAALLAIVAIVGGQILGVSPVAAAGGFSVQVAQDGTGQGTAAGCTITGPGGDNTPTDGVVCTNDTVLYRHGPIAVADERSLVWMLGSTDETLAGDIRATGASVVLGTRDPLVDLILAQRMAVQIAESNGLDPDAPRWASRSVILAS